MSPYRLVKSFDNPIHLLKPVLTRLLVERIRNKEEQGETYPNKGEGGEATQRGQTFDHGSSSVRWALVLYTSTVDFLKEIPPP